eukprot:1078189-Pyramimonas_sp.AAC.1
MPLSPKSGGRSFSTHSPPRLCLRRIARDIGERQRSARAELRAALVSLLPCPEAVRGARLRS